MADLNGKTVLITAAGQGIGRATVLAFARAGAKVIATDINDAALAELAGQANVTTRRLDVLDTAAVKPRSPRSARSTCCSTAPASSMPARSWK